jgi:hypothetical protein
MQFVSAAEVIKGVPEAHRGPVILPLFAERTREAPEGAKGSSDEKRNSGPQE